MSEEKTYILVVEDEEAHAELIRRAFKSRAGRVGLTVARNLREARACLVESIPNLVIADLLLPDGKGTELLPGDNKKSLYPVMVMTSHGDEQAAVEAMKAGALDYVVKSGATLTDMPYFAERALRQWHYITDRKKAEARVLRKNAVLDAINRVFRETLTCETGKDVAKTCLKVVEELTGSKFGLIGEVNKKGHFDTTAVSDPGWDACRMPRSDAVRVIEDMEIRGIWGSVLKGEQSLIINEPACHPDRVGVPKGHPPITCFLGVPLKQADKTIGMIGLANKEGGYSPEDQQAVETLSVALVEALYRKRAEKKLLDYQVQLKSLASKLLLTEERERRRLAAVVHDNIGQNLVLVKLRLQSLIESASGSDMLESMDKVCAVIDQTIQDAHSLTFELSNPVLYELGFEAAVEQWLTEQVQEKYGIKCKFAVDNQPLQLDNEISTILFQAVRELLVNVVKHAKANTVGVSIQEAGGRIRVIVEDDGVGFLSSKLQLPSSQNKTGGFGLFNIRERLEYLGGQLKIKSAPGQGTRIILTAPPKLESKTLNVRGYEYEDSNR